MFYVICTQNNGATGNRTRYLQILSPRTIPLGYSGSRREPLKYLCLSRIRHGVRLCLHSHRVFSAAKIAFLPSPEAISSAKPFSLKYAEFLIRNSRYEDALLKLNSLKNVSKNHYVFFLKSRAFAALQDYDQADKAIIQAIRLNQENYQYYNVLGFINSKNTKLERSLAAYAMAIEKNKANAFAYFNSGIIYTILGSNEKAADYLYKAG